MPMQKNHQLPCTDKHCRTASMQSVVVMDHHMMDMMVITARVEAATGMEAATRMEASPSSPTATCQFQKGLTGSCTKVPCLPAPPQPKCWLLQHQACQVLKFMCSLGSGAVLTRNGLSWSYSRVTNRARSTGLLWYGPATLPVGEPCMTVIWELRVHGTTSCMNSLPGPVAIHLAKTTPLRKPCAHLVRRRRSKSKSKSRRRRRRRRHTNTS